MKIVQLNFSKICCCFTFLISLLKRAMCFVKGHKRTNSDVAIPMKTDSRLPDSTINDLDWDDWGDGAPISIQIDPTNPTNQNQEEPEVDYFTDMVPSFKKPKTIRKKMVGQNMPVAANHSTLSSRLAVSSSVVLPENPELSNWDDSTNENAWDEESSRDLVWEADQVIRQQKQVEREQRLAEHQRRKHEKEMQRESRREASRLAVKLK